MDVRVGTIYPGGWLIDDMPNIFKCINAFLNNSCKSFIIDRYSGTEYNFPKRGMETQYPLEFSI